MKLIIALILLLITPRFSRAEPITLDTPSGTLYGTLKLPKTTLPFPVALILAGSGPTNRDGDTLSLGGENDSLRLLAEGLAAQGIASVRYDKRGVGASAKAETKEANLRFETYIDDAVLWGKKLRSDSRFSSLTIIGHSEGALIGMVASSKLGVDAFVSIAGIGRSPGQVILEQVGAKLPPDLVKQAEQIVKALTEGKTVDVVPAELNSLFRPSVQPYVISWFRYDPLKEIEKLSASILVVQGTTDLQVSVQDAKLLAEEKPSARLLIIGGMNHVLKEVAIDQEQQFRSYIDPALPVVPDLINGVCQFIKGVKGKATSN